MCIFHLFWTLCYLMQSSVVRCLIIIYCEKSTNNRIITGGSVLETKPVERREKKKQPQQRHKTNNNCLLDFSFIHLRWRYAHLFIRLTWTSNLLHILNFSRTKVVTSRVKWWCYSLLSFESYAIEMNYINGKSHKSIDGRDDDICASSSWSISVAN